MDFEYSESGQHIVVLEHLREGFSGGLIVAFGQSDPTLLDPAPAIVYRLLDLVLRETIDLVSVPTAEILLLSLKTPDIPVDQALVMLEHESRSVKSDFGLVMTPLAKYVPVRRQSVDVSVQICRSSFPLLLVESV